MRDKLTGKSRGFGFVSFSDPFSASQAMRQMNRKYIGNRPCSIKVSRWKNQNLNEVKKRKKKREKALRQMGL